ncbi:MULTISPECIES: serine hydrolase domain-containing protein [Bradyrhizobium]|jgi:CubicO group peptidase (beta-lactamase class C family)|uniref:Beta-lactamase family protein n=2 Tax=Bradyrhizobium TaxID=374 RepID=A0ABS5GJJ6_9BRAD|nr:MULTISPECIES: serine hydrolase domain-containing protein [Bradyrhizobium]MBR1141428.1 beta-lactamase family protein [Bradyrhizobium denitrificans]MDU0955320.1 serine hydrolase domain-containing protein [Bradyrhizobium sp.]MDU1492496.1 serine hydrolase domain-containing protein [Bradyrhizobium sp.]MDU1542969.1 serine hydrolase domain-containing protein [Bradyrhizobium sp.]MDU1808757.1 serine hydrolase domain-containing protein [Bradyrhizobium sp.]
MLAPTPASPDTVGMSKAALDRIDAHLRDRYVEAGRFPGTQFLVYRRGKIVHASSLGYADVERKVPVKDDTIYRIYSMTKPITSVAFMMLVEEGKVALDEPVAKYIPEWRNLGVFVAGTAPAFISRPPTRPMLIVDLLRHTSGLTYGFQQRSNVDAAYREAKIGAVEKAGTLQSMIDDLARIPLEFSPGEAWNYSVSTDVIGYLVGKIADKPFEQFLKERIFDPLGMNDTDFHVPATKAHRLAACYSADAGGALSFHAADRKGGLTLQDDPATSSFLSPPDFISGGGGLCATTADYLTFCRALINGGEVGGVRLLGPKTLKLMTSNHLPGGVDLPALSRSMFAEAAYNGIGFGLGFSVTMDPAKTLIAGSPGEYAWGGAASTAFWIDPAEELITIFMTQVLPSNAYPIRRELRTMVYAAITESNL